jgi:hypothetical protein
MRDRRADEWTSEISNLILDTSTVGMLSLRQPILRVRIMADLSMKEDITKLDFLFHAPLPAEVFVQPISRTGSEASVKLARCFDSVAYNDQGDIDQVRISDFIRTLQYVTDPVNPNAGKLACRVYTQRPVEDWIQERISDYIVTRQVTFAVNGKTYIDPSIEEIMRVLVLAQYEQLGLLTDIKKDEL